MVYGIALHNTAITRELTHPLADYLTLNRCLISEALIRLLNLQFGTRYASPASTTEIWSSYFLATPLGSKSSVNILWAPLPSPVVKTGLGRYREIRPKSLRLQLRIE